MRSHSLKPRPTVLLGVFLQLLMWCFTWALFSSCGKVVNGERNLDRHQKVKVKIDRFQVVLCDLIAKFHTYTHLSTLAVEICFLAIARTASHTQCIHISDVSQYQTPTAIITSSTHDPTPPWAAYPSVFSHTQSALPEKPPSSPLRAYTVFPPHSAVPPPKPHLPPPAPPL